MSIEDYNNYLQLKGFVSQKHLPFYIQWGNRKGPIASGSSSSSCFTR